MNIWIDADSCPSMVRNHAAKIANKNNITIYFVANREIPLDSNFSRKMIICKQEKDAADNYILSNCEKNDLIITKDILFAKKLVKKNITCINDRGIKFTKDSISELCAKNTLDSQLEEIGLVKHYHEEYDKKKFTLFANCFDRELQRLLSKEKNEEK